MAQEATLFTQTMFEDKQPGIDRLECEELTLRNFKGIENLTVRIPSAGLDVYGRNASGKTTLADAFMWLLFDKDSANRKDFEIKTLTPNGKPIHNLEHEVSGAFSWKGKRFTLRKVYTEKWTQKRGSAEKVLTGHETTYYVDGVPKKKQDYEAFIAAIVDERKFRLLTDPTYFNEQLHWTERRKMLLEIAGGVRDDEIIAANPSLKGFLTVLGGLLLDDLKAKSDSERKVLEKELKQIPARISEVKRSIPSDLDGVTAEGLDADLAKLQEAHKKKTEELVRAEQGNGVGDKIERLAQVRAEMSRLEVEAREKQAQAIEFRRNKMNDFLRLAKDAEIGAQRESEEAKRLAEEIKTLDGKLTSLREKWSDVDSEEFTYEAEAVCPTCGQDLPEEKIEEARQKAQEQFNLSKAERLEAINAEGKATKERLRQLEKAHLEKVRSAAQNRKAAEEAQAGIAQLKDEIAKLSGPVNVDTPEYRKLASERDLLEVQIEEIKDGARLDTSKIRSEIETLDKAVEALQQAKAKLTQKQAAEERIAELQAQEKELSAKLEAVLKNLALCSEYEKTQARLLEDRVKPHFRLAEFKLFDEQVNGTLSPCCETMFKGVPYGTALNRGMRMNVGLDIINTLQKHLKMSAPVWIDNAEAVTDLTPVNAQVIQLIVSKADDNLRFEEREDN
jgi:DNA repair exonuclease SbcCD ATPase subunit